MTDMVEGFSGEKITLESGNLTPEQLVQNLEGTSLFAEERLVVLENLTGNKQLLEVIPEISRKLTLIVWEGKKLTKGQLDGISKKLPGVSIQEFKEDPVVFKLVEAIRPGNKKEMIPWWQKYCQNYEPEMGLVMIARQIRLMLVVADPKKRDQESSQIPEWQKQKLAGQARFFGFSKLVELYQELLVIDYENKSGQSAVDLATRLELWLLSI